MRRARSAIRSYLVVSLLVCVACQGEVITATTTPEPTTTSSTVPSTTSARPTTSTTVAPTTTAPSVAGTCEAQPSAEVPADATEAVVITGDVDGDGQEDTVTGYLWEGGSYLHLGLASGWGTSIRVDGLIGSEGSPPTSMPARVVTMSGDSLIVSVAGLALPGPVFALFALRDCGLSPVTSADGSFPDLWAGGNPGQDSWFTCDSSGVTMLDVLIEDFAAEPRIYTGGDGSRLLYEPPFFGPAGEVPLDLAFPATREQALAALPSCGL